MAEVGSVGKIYLEGLMSRAEILFVSGYIFLGELNLQQLRDSYHAIVDRVSKFNHQLDFRAQDDFDWRPEQGYGERFHVYQATDLEDELKELARRGFELREGSNNHPMNLVVVQQADEAREEFLVAMLCSHEYVDARSAETVFHLVLDHYNATVADDQKAVATAEQAASKLTSIDTEAMVQILAGDGYDVDHNTELLGAYPTADAGEYGVRVETLTQHLPEFRQRERKPLSCVVDASGVIAHCRQQFPEVSKNAVITAVVHKAIYNINVRDKAVSDKHLVSGRMVADLLSPEQRQQYIGNYISFVPISTSGSASLERTAKAVHDRIVEFKSQQFDLSCFELVEQAANANAVGSGDDELSYVITNWNNYRFLAGETMLAGCETLAHRSAVNVDPQDNAGAALINRAIIVINLSPNDELCLSMFPSLRDDGENRRLIAEVEQLLSETE